MYAVIKKVLPAVGAGLICATGAQAQVPEQRLTLPESQFPEALSSVTGIRELPDGRLMVADGLGQALVVIDLKNGTVDTIGRTGQGPEEYKLPDRLFPLPGDSTLLLDLGNGRLTVLGPDFAFGETTPVSQGRPGPGNMSIRLPRGIDSRGYLYYEPIGGGGRPGGGLPDSAAILQWERSSGTIDTVGMVKLRERVRSESGSANNRNVSIRPVPMSPQDAWAVGLDGAIAVVRSDSYRLEWIMPDGRVVRGPANAYKPIKIRQADKEAYIDEQARNALGVMMEAENGQVRTTFSRGRIGRQQNIDNYEWPDVMPAFRANRVFVAPNGEAWVQRYASAGSPAHYDVFNRAAQLVRTVVLPEGREVVALGERAVYVTWPDEFDLIWLEKYALSG